MTAQIQIQPKEFMQKNDDAKKKLFPPVISSRQAEHNKAQEGKALDKILKTIYDLTAKVGTLRKAMDWHGISSDGESEPKHGKGFRFEKQKPNLLSKFAMIAKKKGKLGNLQASSLVQNNKILMTYSEFLMRKNKKNNATIKL